MLAKLQAWLESRYPVRQQWQRHFTAYHVPGNLNFWYCFGVLAVLVLVLQFISGLWLTFYYTPTLNEAFASIEQMMRDVQWGWLFRYIHTTGASAFFIVIYLHIMRSILYGSYKKPRELIWITGLLLYLLLMLEAFCGYVLPWGQMSYWAVQVLSSTLSAVPYIGDSLVTWVRGDYTVSGATLHRCFALHVIAIPLLLLIFIKSHITALRHVGSSNPSGDEPIAKIPFHPFYTIKDLLVIAIFLVIFAAIVFFMPDMGGYFIEANNFLPADPMQTPAHIATPWYIAPFYAILRAIPDKGPGILATVFALLLWFFLPWIDRCKLKPLQQRRLLARVIMGIIISSFCILGYLGLAELTPAKLLLARIMGGSYLTGFILLYIYSRFEKV